MYTIERVTSLERVLDLSEFFVDVSKNLSQAYDGIFAWDRFLIGAYAREHYVWVCFADGVPVGCLLARLGSSVFDPDVTVLTQDTLYSVPGRPRATYHLLRHFIDFGRANADHVFTMIAEKSNIKGRSLERLGFKPSEQHFWLEVKRGQGRSTDTEN